MPKKTNWFGKYVVNASLAILKIVFAGRFNSSDDLPAEQPVETSKLNKEAENRATPSEITKNSCVQNRLCVWVHIYAPFVVQILRISWCSYSSIDGKTSINTAYMKHDATSVRLWMSVDLESPKLLDKSTWKRCNKEMLVSGQCQPMW